MKITKRILAVACTLSSIAIVRRVVMGLKIVLEIREDRLVGLNNPDFTGLQQSWVRACIYESCWYLAITILLAIALYRLRNSN